MDAYPVFIRISGRPCLVVGGGLQAERKAELLIRAGARLVVCASHLTDQLAAWRDSGEIQQHAAPFAPSLLQDQTLVVVATSDEDLAQRVSVAARQSGVPINVVDRPELSTFISGAVVDRSPVLIAISTGGAAPFLAREVRHTIERLLPQTLGQLARFAQRFRHAAKAMIPDSGERRRFWERFPHSAVACHVLSGEESVAQGAMLSLINRHQGDRLLEGAVRIIEISASDPDLLTLRAARHLAEADAIVHDDGIDAAYLEIARRDAERIALTRDVDKAAKAEIEARLLKLARAGKRIAYLKGRDLLFSDHGSGDVAYLRAQGVSAELVPAFPAVRMPAAAVNA